MERREREERSTAMAAMKVVFCHRQIDVCCVRRRERVLSLPWASGRKFRLAHGGRRA